MEKDGRIKIFKEPVISVITVVFNDVKNIERAMLSVLNQTYKNIEYIIIDGGSTDGTVEVIKMYANRLAYWVSEQDGGIADAMNKGVDKATGVWVNFLNSDDFFINNTIFEEIFSTEHTADVLYGSFIGNINGRVMVCEAPDSVVEKAWQGMRACHSTLFTRLAIQKKFKFDTSYKVSADGDFLSRCVVEGCSFENLKKVIFQVGTPGNSYQYWFRGRLENWRFARKYFPGLRTDLFHLWGLIYFVVFRSFKRTLLFFGVYNFLRKYYRKWVGDKIMRQKYHYRDI